MDKRGIIIWSFNTHTELQHSLLVSVNYSLAATGILFFMAIFGFIFHLWAIIDAARYRG
jgi:hypothetical protein